MYMEKLKQTYVDSKNIYHRLSNIRRQNTKCGTSVAKTVQQTQKKKKRFRTKTLTVKT